MPTQSLSLQGVDAVSGAAPVIQSAGGSESSIWKDMLDGAIKFYSQGGTTTGVQSTGSSPTNSVNAAQGSSQIIEAASSAFSNIGKGFGFGFGYSMGYNGIKMLTEPYLAYRAAKHEKAMLGMQADLANMQAAAYQSAAEDILRAGQQQVAEATYNMGQSIASTRVSQASSGVHVAGSGSTAEVIANQRIVTEMQVNQIMANAINQSFGYQRGKVEARGRALAFSSARSTINPWISAISAHISAASKSIPNMIQSYAKAKGGGQALSLGGGSGGGLAGLSFK
nr:MAG TPA: hypothetical protein [Caudoviricetes sp.]